ncbi:MAG: hypothetical protein JXM70_24530 [Pirellulales bacterium]|nr:hypothetical protein [Pirellulales bacterium]
MPPETLEIIAARFEGFQKFADFIRLLISPFGSIGWNKLQPLFEASTKLPAIEQASE